MKLQIAWVAKKLISFIPPETIKFIYLKICRPKLLRMLTNGVIKLFIPEVLEIAEGKVFLDTNDVEVCGALALGAHDPFEIEIFRAKIKPGMTVVDIGANIGYYTVIAAGRVGHSGKVISYEPEEKNFILLTKNISENHFVQAVAVKTAISNRKDKETMFLAEKHTGIHSMINNRNFSRGIEVDCDTLDHSLEEFDSPKVDILKMDIEGFEIIALLGMQKTLEKSDKLIMFVEFYPQAIERLHKSPIDFLKTLHVLGFTLSVIDEDTRKILPLELANFDGFISGIPKTGEVVRNILATKQHMNA